MELESISRGILVGDEKLGERVWLEIKLRKLRTEIVGRPINANLGV